MQQPSFNICPATKEDAAFIDRKLSESIRNQTHLTQETLLKNYVLKTMNRLLLALMPLFSPGVSCILILYLWMNNIGKKRWGALY